MAFNVPLKNTIAKQRPVTKQTPWVRPADWINITGVNDNEAIYLVSDMGDKTFKLFCSTFSSADIYVDWGDGTIDTVAHSTSIEHTYSTGGTPCSRGYNTFKIRVYVDPGVVLSSANFVQTSTRRRLNFPVYLLEAYFGNGSNLSFAGRFTGNGFNYPILEYVKMPTTLTGGQNSLDSTFYSCRSLYKVDMPTSASVLTNIQYAFYQCYNLQTIAIPSDATEISSMTFAFNGCSSLTSISLPTTLNSVTSLASTFNGCSALGTMILPSTNACTSFASTFINCYSLTYACIKSMAPNATSLVSTFSGCRSLLSVEIQSMANTGTLDMTSTFQNCGLLTSVKIAAPSALLNVTASTTFSACGSLQYIKLPTNFNATTLFSAFANCSALQRIDMPTSMPGLTNLSIAFNNCQSLTDINFPATVGVISSFNQAFSGCNSISEITIPATWTCSSSTFSSTFSGCFNLTKVNLLSTFAGSPLMDNMFNNCYSLETIVTSASFNTILSNTNGVNTMFQNCSSLKEFAFPATMATSTFVSTFSGCSALRSVTMPTSAVNVTTFGGTFFNCTALKSVTLPATVGAAIAATFTSTFFNCISLETVTLPVTQITAGINATSMFSGCYALKTINNTNKFGSTLTTGNVVNFTTFKINSEELISLTLVPRISKLEVQGTATNVSKLNSLRLTNTGTGQWSGTSPQINVSFTDITYANLVILFNDIAAQGNVTAKTINITSCAGAASLTAADRLILTSRGWTITG